MANNFFDLFTEMERDERITLVNQLQADSEWNKDFFVMLGSSVMIAGLGLMQNSTAVVIGAMLVAPLMTPLIGAGLALVQGNLQLLKVALKSIVFGTILSIILGSLIEIVTPHWELSQEVAARAGPNILDLFIAFFAGISAAYAIANPKLSGALPGVAIAVALVPPITVTGIALGNLNYTVAEGSLILYLTNMVAIILGSAIVFWIHGLHLSRSTTLGAHTNINRIIIALSCFLIFLFLPLGLNLNEQLIKGDERPLAHPLSYKLYAALKDRLSSEKGIDYLLGGRPGADRPNDVVLWLKANRPVPEQLIKDLEKTITDIVGKDVKPLIVPLKMASIEKTSTETEESEP